MCVYYIMRPITEKHGKNWQLLMIKKIFKKENGRVLVDKFIRKHITNKGMTIRGHKNGRKINITRKFVQQRRRRSTQHRQK
jgi:3-hydroxymyristoyl/3-hydroxydecanoyl-(acyl carrier protein) dehydratase